jgi:hypothetical protein
LSFEASRKADRRHPARARRKNASTWTDPPLEIPAEKWHHQEVPGPRLLSWREAIRRLIVLITVAAVGFLIVSQGLTAATPQLPVNNLASQAGKLIPLKAGVTYQASKFPLALRVTAPDASWLGAQWKSSARGEHSTKPPFFGWVWLSVSFENSAPQGLIEILASYTRTPSVATTVRNLRTRGHGATYGPTSSVALAGFHGSRFDGKIVGSSHTFIPFTPKQNIARYYGDATHYDKGEVFRVVVLNVRHKTVVIYTNSATLPPADFPTFLAKADLILKSLKFPG